MPEKNKIISIEEHFWTANLRDRYTGYARVAPHHPTKQLDDLGELRLRQMDEAGIDFQIISHMQPGTQTMDPENAVKFAREANDKLYEAMRAHPTRFGGFAEIPTPDPKAAADELERTVVKYGFKGALVSGLTNGTFLDDKQFWGIFERAQALDVRSICIRPYRIRRSWKRTTMTISRRGFRLAPSFGASWRKWDYKPFASCKVVCSKNIPSLSSF